MLTRRLARLLRTSAGWPVRVAVDSSRLVWQHPLRFAGITVKMFAFFHLVEAYFVTLAPASGPSMLPTLETVGDTVLFSRLNRFGRRVRVGDLVVYVIPPYPTTVGIKRVIGMPGDYVLKNPPDSGSGEMIQVGFCSPERAEPVADGGCRFPKGIAGWRVTTSGRLGTHTCLVPSPWRSSRAKPWPRSSPFPRLGGYGIPSHPRQTWDKNQAIF